MGRVTTAAALAVAVTAGVLTPALLGAPSALAASSSRVALPRLSRRRFVQSAGASLVGAAIAGDVLAGTAQGAVPELTPRTVVPAALGQLAAVPFHGSHQAGILTPQPPAAVFVSFDVVSSTRQELAELFQELTTLGRFLSTGGTPPDLGVASPPSDSASWAPSSRPTP